MFRIYKYKYTAWLINDFKNNYEKIIHNIVTHLRIAFTVTLEKIRMFIVANKMFKAVFKCKRAVLENWH